MSRVNGVCRKKFEDVLARLLSKNLNPVFIPLPSPPQFQQTDLDELPPAARIHGSLRGQIPDPKKAQRKEDQVLSLMRCIFALLPNDVENQTNEKTIVDFGGGSGHLSLLLAVLCPRAKVIVVDLKKGSLDLLHQKARMIRVEQERVVGEDQEISADNNDGKDKNSLKATAIPNLFSFFGDVESFNDPFDIGVALHVCGEATDVVIRKCLQKTAHIIAAPCCVGKISSANKDPYIFHAREARRNATLEESTLEFRKNTISYPQSQQFMQCIECNGGTDGVAKDWNSLASAADTAVDMNDRRNATRRTAKTLVEFDRQLFLQEYPYQTALTRMDPLTASPKNDILIGYYKGEGVTNNPFLESAASEDPVCVWTKQHLLHPGASSVETGKVEPPEPETKTRQLKTSGKDGVDWTWEEEQEIRNRITKYFAITQDEVEPLTFPSRMGRRKRKLIHFVAEDLGLVHICIGKKNSEKAVAVRRRYVEHAETPS